MTRAVWRILPTETGHEIRLYQPCLWCWYATILSSAYDTSFSINVPIHTALSRMLQLARCLERSSHYMPPSARLNWNWYEMGYRVNVANSNAPDAICIHGCTVNRLHSKPFPGRRRTNKKGPGMFSRASFVSIRIIIERMQLIADER